MIILQIIVGIAFIGILAGGLGSLLYFSAWMTVPTKQEKADRLSKGQFSLKMLGICMIVMVPTYSFVASVHHAEDDQENAQKQAKEDAATKQQDEQAAQKMGLDYVTYEKLKPLQSDAHSKCQNELLHGATYGADVDWLGGGYSWTTDGTVIHIYGTDIKIKNAFGTERQISYQCDYDTASKAAVVVRLS